MSTTNSVKEYEKSSMAMSVGRDIPVSRKQSVEICNRIRYKKLSDAKNILNGVISLKKAIHFGRYNADLGHKPKIGPGSYPVKASTEILKVIENAEANAQFKGLNTSNFYISRIKVDQSPKSWHYGRKRRRKVKRATIELVIGEKSSKSTSNKKKPSKNDAVSK